MKIEEIEKRKIIMIEVKESPEKPVFFKNHAYKRVGKVNQRISSSEMRKLAKESGAKVYWDELVCEEAKLEDIEEKKARWFLKEARKQRGLNLSEDVPIEEALMKLKLLFKQLFWVKYVEDVGGGTLDMISRCREWGIPEPVFEHITGAFVVTFKLKSAREKGT